MKTILVKHRGLARYVQCEDKYEDFARAEVKKRIDYQLDQKSIRDKRIADYKKLIENRDDAYKKAIENLNFTFPPLLLQLLSEYGLKDVAISNTSLHDSPLCLVIPQLKVLARDMHAHRKYLDQGVLKAYWDSEQALENHFLEREVS